MITNPNPSPELQEYSVDDQGRFCRHCGRASWLHHRVIGGGNFCDAPATSVGDRVRIRDDVRRFGGRIGTVERFHKESISQCPIELRLDDGSTYYFRASEIERLAALSPQTLPAPGEVERRNRIGRELIGWDNQMSPEAIAHPNNAAFFAHWLDVTDPNDGEQAKHYQAGIDMMLRLAPTLATVAAANDEGVAIAIEALEPFARVHPHKNEAGASAILIPVTVADVRRAAAAIRLLSHTHKGVE